MNFEKLPSQLTLKFEAADLDILQLGIVNSHLHALFNQVAIAILQEEDEHRVAKGETRLLETIPQTPNRDDTLIRARVMAVRQGSIELDLQTVILSMFSVPGAIAVLQNLASNVIWAIATFATRDTAAKILKHVSAFDSDHRVKAVAGRKRLGTKVEKFVQALAQSTNGGRIYFKSEDEELEIEFNGPSRHTNAHDDEDDW